MQHPLFAQQLEQLQLWLAKGYEGQLQFMHGNHHLRAHPEQLVEGAKTIISVRMDYLTETPKPRTVEDDDRPNHGIIARQLAGATITRPCAVAQTTGFEDRSDAARMAAISYWRRYWCK